jgi:ribosomal protein L39E
MPFFGFSYFLLSEKKFKQSKKRIAKAAQNAKKVPMHLIYLKFCNAKHKVSQPQKKE